MLRTSTLLFIYFLGHLHIFTNSHSVGDYNSCTRLENCSHIHELVKSRRSSYGVVTLLNLLHCQYRHRQTYVRCIDPEKMKDFLERAALIPNEEQCGLENPEDKISGGQNTNIDDYPWIALLKYRVNSKKIVYGCHGNLISRRYLLTAAHCVDPVQTQSRIEGNLSSVVLGEYDIRTTRDCISTDCAADVEERLIESYHIHPNFNSSNFVNDIALIRMDAEVNYSEFIAPICLPPKTLIAPFDEVLLVAGWGTTETDVMNPVKVRARFKLKPQETCRVNVKLNRKQFCAGSTHNAQTCPGDSGGPLMMRRTIDHTNRLFLVGVYSLGVGCLFRDSISIYTKVSSYIEWILTTVHK